MLVQRLAAGGREGVGAHGLDADLVAAGLHGLLDVGLDALFKGREELVLLGDGEREQPVQEPRHGRQVFLESALVDELEAGRLLEVGERPPLDGAPPERHVELPQRRLGIQALQVVALAEERRVAAHRGLRIALAARDRAERVEPARDCGDEPPLALHVGGDGAEQRRGRLVRAMRAAEPLYRLVGPPSRLQQIVDAPLGVAAGEIGVIAPPGPPRHREHEDALAPVHEGGGLGEVRRGGTAAERETLAARIGDLQHPARPAGDLGHGIVPEVLHELVERRRHRRQ